MNAWPAISRGALKIPDRKIQDHDYNNFSLCCTAVSFSLAHLTRQAVESRHGWLYFLHLSLIYLFSTIPVRSTRSIVRSIIAPSIGLIFSGLVEMHMINLKLVFLIPRGATDLCGFCLQN